MASTACDRSVADAAESGQGTVEFALVTMGFIAVVIAFSALWRMFGEGRVVEHALISASHHIDFAAVGVAADVLLF